MHVYNIHACICLGIYLTKNIICIFTDIYVLITFLLLVLYIRNIKNINFQKKKLI